MSCRNAGVTVCGPAARVHEFGLTPKLANWQRVVAQVVGYIKGKSAIQIARTFIGKRRNFTGENFWARGYFVSTVGRDESTIRQYIRNQEAEDKRLDQLRLW